MGSKLNSRGVPFMEDTPNSAVVENPVEDTPVYQVLKSKKSKVDPTKKKHSTTFYLPRKYNTELQRAILIRAKELCDDGSGIGKASKYIYQLIMSDLIAAGLFTEEKTPNDVLISALEEKYFRGSK
jgi:hypothetical protein